jgi:hypothetical protein
MRPRRGGRWLPAGLGIQSCPACYFRMDKILAEQGWDRHPWCSGWPDGSRVKAYATFPSSVESGRSR